MRLTINGKVNKKDVPSIKDAVHFYADQLMSKSLIKKLKITIRFVPDMKHVAEVVWTGTSVRPKSFLIYVNPNRSRSKTRLLKALGHELTHVKQFATGELKDLCTDEVRWKDKIYPFPDENSKNPETYWNAPWEIEAYGREMGLYHLYKKHLTEQKRLACRKK